MAKGKSIGITILILVVLLAGAIFYAYKQNQRAGLLSEEIENLNTKLSECKEGMEQMKVVSEKMAVQAVDAQAGAEKARKELEDCRNGR